MPLELKRIDNKKVGFFRFKELDGEYLLTNDIGEYCFLDPQHFDLFLSGGMEKAHPDKYRELQGKGFIRDMLDFDGLVQKYATKNAFLGKGPSLHIVVITLRCDHKCVYCQAGSKDLGAKGFDMDIPTAEKVVDRIFESPNRHITIEFQGGEPLVNLDTVKFIVKYAKKKNRIEKRDLRFALVTNFTFMTQDILKYLVKNNIGICTSLDGPESMHNKQRFLKEKNSYKNTVKWIKGTRKEFQKNNFICRPTALITLTRFSLSYPQEIVESYVELDLEGIHLRPANPFGLNKKSWKKIGSQAEEFLDFYKEALDYIIELNLKGIFFYERTARIFLGKIFNETDPDFLDMRSPCGAGIGQLAYNFNGDVYTCDEARMLSVTGEESFRLGNASENSYRDFMDNDIVKTLCLASCLDNLPGCNECVYKPYCGVCPVFNYTIGGNIFSQIPNNERCKINRGILDYIFEKLQNKKNKEVFLKWLKSEI